MLLHFLFRLNKQETFLFLVVVFLDFFFNTTYETTFSERRNQLGLVKKESKGLCADGQSLPKPNSQLLQAPHLNIYICPVRVHRVCHLLFKLSAP